MTKQEFEERIGKKVTEKDYNIIEKVYTWHPSISETEGKQEIADLYNRREGMTIIKGMYEAARMIEDLDSELRKLRALEEKIRKRMVLVAKGDLAYEKCRQDTGVFLERAGGPEWNYIVDLLKERYGSQTVEEVLEDTGLNKRKEK